MVLDLITNKVSNEVKIDSRVCGLGLFTNKTTGVDKDQAELYGKIGT